MIPRVAARKARDLTIDDIRGMKQLRREAGMLSFLHEVGCGLDRAGSRELHFDDYVLLVLRCTVVLPQKSCSAALRAGANFRYAWRRARDAASD